GDLVGTLQYMAPESLHGQSGPQSDIYSLGLTLWELITREPPFPDATPARLLKQISEQGPVRPRLRDPSIPRDLETIVLKAIAAEPRDRYPTAGALADDLTRWIEDRPIMSRRISSLERCWRWSRRNRALASSAAAALVCLVLATVIGWWAFAVTSRALKGAEDRRIEAEVATRHAEDNMQLSLQALEEIFAAIAPPEDELRDGPRRPPLQEPQFPLLDQLLGFGDGPAPPRGPHHGDGPEPRHEGEPGGGPGPRHHGDEADAEQRRGKLLHAVLGFYERFAQQNATDSKLQSEAAKAQRRVGQIHARMGEQPAARQAIQHSAASFAELAREFPEQGNYQLGLLEAYLALAALERDAGDAKAMLSAADKAEGAGEQLTTSFADNNVYNAKAVSMLSALAEMLERSGALEAAEACYRRAVPPAERLAAARFGRPGGAAENLAELSAKLAALQVTLKRSGDAAATLENSIGRLESQRKNARIDQLLKTQYEALAEIVPDTNRAAQLRNQARRLRDDRPRRPLDGDGPPHPGPPPPAPPPPHPFAPP
ncbi:MAG TPA: protein kinase, partial [Pirellulales bacterium]|nr:protein kinase [Pirellulales bacterium]